LLGSYLLVVVLAPHLLALEKYEPVQLQPNLDQTSNLTAGNWQNPAVTFLPKNCDQDCTP
jgi:hypothetical protein